MDKFILVADDNPAIRHLVASTVDGFSGAVAVTASDGAEAIELAKKHRPFLALVDVMMPKADGFEVCRTIKATPETSTCRVIMLTALGSDSDREAGKSAGADDYMTKPFSPVELLEKISRYMSG